jgi:hypothetical protein
MDSCSEASFYDNRLQSRRKILHKEEIFFKEKEEEKQ